MTLTVGGKQYGYQLWEDQTGQRHWGEGLAPLITPQQRISGFSYDHVPPEIDMPSAFEDWSGGAGFVEHGASKSSTSNVQSNLPSTYSYSQGIDASWGNRLYLSPARQTTLASTGAEVAAAPTFFFNSTSFGFWCICATYMYKYDLSSASWVLKNTAAANVTSIAELNGVMYAALSASAYIYSTDGTTWTTYTGAAINSASIADLFVVRGNVIMAMRVEKAYVTTNAQNGGVAWSAGTSIGHTSETTQSLAVANGDYWIFKKEGIYNWDGATVADVWKPQYLESTNGKYSYVGLSGIIYVTYASRILAIDPFNTTDTPLQFVYPADSGYDTQDSVEIKGTISQITGTFSDIYFTVTNPQGRVYLMKGKPEAKTFHTYAYLDTSANVACAVVGPTVQHATNPTVAIGYGTAARYYILPRADLKPEDDLAYRYQSTGTLYGPWLSYGARSFNKFLNKATLLGSSITAGHNAKLGCYIDDDSTHINLLDAQDYGLNSYKVVDEISFYRVKYDIVMNSPSGTSTPIVVGAVLHATLNPPRRKMWKPIIVLKPNSLLRDGIEDTQDVSTLRSALFAAANSRITMTDRENQSFVVRLLDAQEVQLAFSTEGGSETDNQVLQLTLVEVNSLSSPLPPARYTQARYNQSYRYS